jgi:hypothetical protein
MGVVGTLHALVQREIGSGVTHGAFRLREFLSRDQVPFARIDLEEEPGIAEALADFEVSERDVSVVAYGGEPLMRNPSILEMAERLRLRCPIRTVVYDLVIIGAGPARLAAPVNGASGGLSTLVLGAVAPGGQAGASARIENHRRGDGGEHPNGRGTNDRDAGAVQFHRSRAAHPLAPPADRDGPEGVHPHRLAP